MSITTTTAAPGATCTVVIGGEQYRCGQPAVITLTTGRGTYHECAEHAPAPVADEPVAVQAPHPPTRTTQPYVLVAQGRIVGYAAAITPAVRKRAARLHAAIVPVAR